MDWNRPFSHLSVDILVIFLNFLQASLPECCPYPVNDALVEMQKPREELVRILGFSTILEISIL